MLSPGNIDIEAAGCDDKQGKLSDRQQRELTSFVMQRDWEDIHPRCKFIERLKVMPIARLPGFAVHQLVVKATGCAPNVEVAVAP